MINYKFIALLLFIVVASCNTDNEFKNEIPKSNIEINRKINCSDVLSLNRIVKLETSQKSIIGNIDEVVINDSLIYVLDKNITKSVFIFNDKGQFVNKISKNGKGPNEYIRISSFTYDIYNKELLIVDPAGRKLLIFSEMGIFKESIRLDDYFEFIHVLDKDHFIFYSNFNSRKRKQFSISNKTGQILKRFRKIHKKHFGWGYSYNVFCGNNDITLFTVPYDNTIYSVLGNKPEGFFSFAFNGYFINSDANSMSRNESDKLYLEIAKGKKIITALEGLLQVDNILYFSFNYKAQIHSVFYDIEKGKIIQAGILTSDMNNLFIGENKPIGQSKDELIFLLEPIKELKRYNRLRTIAKYAQYTKKYKVLFESPEFDLNSNPALLFFKVKK